jgi:hypothetical protein
MPQVTNHVHIPFKVYGLILKNCITFQHCISFAAFEAFYSSHLCGCQCVEFSARFARMKHYMENFIQAILLATNKTLAK